VTNRRPAARSRAATRSSGGRRKTLHIMMRTKKRFVFNAAVNMVATGLQSAAGFEGADKAVEQLMLALSGSGARD